MPLERLELLSEHGCFGGVQRFYKHFNVNEIGLPMRFALFLPPQAQAGRLIEASEPASVTTVAVWLWPALAVPGRVCTQPSGVTAATW